MDMLRKHSEAGGAAGAGEDKKEPVLTKIVWQGGGRNVVLARAGDNDWKGRQQMEPEYVLYSPPPPTDP